MAIFYQSILRVGIFVVFSLATPFISAEDSGLLRDDLSSFCAAYTEHVPTSDSAFTPGVAANGERVEPADLPTDFNIDPKNILIPITLDIAMRLGLEFSKAVESEAVLGFISLQDGQALFNGRPLKAGQNAAILQLCDLGG